MNRGLRVFLTLALVSVEAFLFGQFNCPPGSSEPPPSECVCQVTPICGFDALDSYCLPMSSFQTPFSGFPGCASNVLNNPNWFAFVAGSTNLNLLITPSNCQGLGGGGGVGVQAAIYSGNPDEDQDCSTCNPSSQSLQPLAQNCGCTDQPINWNLTTVPGTTYYIVIDGCGGDICQIDVSVLSGGDPPSVDDPFDIDWPSDGFVADTICLGATGVPMTLAEIFGASSYLWTLPDGSQVETDAPIITLDWNEEGTFQICVSAQNDCDLSDQYCEDVVVAELPNVVEPPVEICEGETYNWNGQAITETGTYFATLFNGNGCQFQTEIFVNVYEENDEDPTEIIEVICIEDAPFVYHGNAFSMTTNTQVTIPAANGVCDSFVNIDLTVISATVILGDPTCLNEVIQVCPVSQVFSPNPDVDASAEVFYEWRDLGTGALVGNEECLEVSIYDLIQPQTTFSLTVTMTYNGEPMPGCVSGPFTVDVDLNDFLPVLDTVLGPDTVCVGDTGVFDAIMGGQVDIVFYDWDITAVNGAMFEFGPGSEQIGVSFSNGGFGEICVTPVSICGPGDQVCTEVYILPPPNPNAGPDDVVCDNIYQMQGIASTVGFWTLISAPTNGTATFDDPTDPATNVTVDSSGLYVFEWTEGLGSCILSDQVAIEFADAPMVDGTAQLICDGAGENYEVVLNIIGGTQPYVVLSGNGSFNGNVFTSDITTSGTEIMIEITDANGCGPLMLTYNRLCDCNTFPGEMSLVALEDCEDACIQTEYLGGDMPDANDVSEFILHTNSGTSLGTIISRNTTGEFCFVAPPMTAGTQYYVSFVIGNDDGSGLVDLNDACLGVSQGQPVTFLGYPTPDAGADQALCGQSTTLAATASIGMGEWSQVSGPGVATFDAPNDPASGVSVDAFGSYTFKWEEDNGGCIDSALVNVDFDDPPTLVPGSLMRICNNTQTAYNVTFEIQGGVEPYTEINGRGDITGNVFTIEDLVPEVQDSFVIEDANGCGPLVVVVNQSCNCDTDAGTMDTTLVEGCEDDCLQGVANNDEMLDADDAVIFVLHDSPGMTLGTVFAQGPDEEFCFADAMGAISCDVTYYISRVVGNSDGMGGVDFFDGCTMVAAGTAVVWYCNPVADAGPDANECGLSYTLNANPTVGSGSWGSSGSGNPIFDVVNAPSTLVTVDAFGTHCFTWTENNNGCVSTDEVCISFLSTPVIDQASIQYDCNANFDGYTVSFLITGGDPANYVVDGSFGGSINGSTFTSNEIPSNTPFFYEVYDANDCERDTLQDVFDCGCFSDASTMTTTPMDPCEDETIDVTNQYDPSSAMLDGNDILTYILHDNDGPALGNILIESTSPSFAFDAGAGMVLETTYYISAVVGNDAGGMVDQNDGCLSVAAGIPVTWRVIPDVSITPSNTEITCQMPQVILSVESSLPLGEYTFLWVATNGGNIEAGDETLPDARVNTAGTYTVSMMHSQYGCVNQASIDITQSDDVPVITIATPENLTCERLEVVLDATGSSGGAGINYTWSGPGVSGPTDQIMTTATLPGIYTFEINNTTNGCRTSGTIEVFEDIEAPQAQANASGMLDCDTDEITVSGVGSSSGGEFSYSWEVVSTSGNIVSGQNSIDAIVNDAGTYRITVRNSVNGCESTADVEVLENDNLISDATLEVTQPGCAGETNGSIVVSQVDGGTPPYEYSFDGGLTFSPNNQVNFIGAGTYDIVIRDDAGCTFSTSAELFDSPEIFVDLGESILVESGDPVTLVAEPSVPTSSLASIIWQPLVDTASANSLSQTFIPPPGQSEYAVTIIDSIGCSATDRVVVVARVSRDVFIPNALNPNSEVPQNRYIGIYADPDKVAGVTTFMIFDRWGNNVFERFNFAPGLELNTAVAWDGTFNGDDLNPGVFSYFAEVVFQDGVTLTYKGAVTLVK